MASVNMGMSGPLPSSEKLVNWCVLAMPTSESPQRMAWSRNVNGLSLCSVKQPQRQLRHLDRQRVLVHAVQAPLGDDPPGVDQPLVGVVGDQHLAGLAGGDLAVRA